MLESMEMAPVASETYAEALHLTDPHFTSGLMIFDDRSRPLMPHSSAPGYSSGRNRHTDKLTRRFRSLAASVPSWSTSEVAPWAIVSSPTYGYSAQSVGGGIM